jgi:hypothetical protein
MNKIIYPPCKKCGASHGMGVKNMETGHIEQIDLCSDCLWHGTVTPVDWHIMTDVAKCSGIGCSKREDCYRYTCPGDTYQAWIDPQECMKNDYALFYPWKTNMTVPKMVDKNDMTD